MKRNRVSPETRDSKLARRACLQDAERAARKRALVPSVDCIGDQEIATAWDDSDFAVCGRDPWKSIGNDAVLIPEAPGSDDFEGVPPAILRARYLIRLCGYEQGENERSEITGLRLLSTIGFLPSEGVGGGAVPREIEVESPLWNFPDGNISYHLRVERSVATRGTYVTAEGYRRGWSNTVVGTSAAILFNQGSTSPGSEVANYVPANGGVPPGNPVGHLGTIRNNAEFPWHLGANNNVHYRICGKATVTLWASVLQSDPSTRPSQSVIVADGGARREDNFVYAYPLAVYRHVAGAIRFRKV